MSKVARTRQESNHFVEPFAMVPESLITCPCISTGAFRLWVALDKRQGSKAHQRVSQRVLAADLAVDVRTVRRLLAELEATAWLSGKRTGRTTLWSVHNPARTSPDRTSVSALIGHFCPIRQDRIVLSTEKELFDSHQASNSRSLPVHPAATAADRTVAAEVVEPVSAQPVIDLRDTNDVQVLLALLPERIRPAETKSIRASVNAALSHGWTVEALADRITTSNTNQYATNPPGISARILEELATSEPDQPTSAAKPLITKLCAHDRRRLAVGSCPECDTADEARARADLAERFELAELAKVRA